ncbi:hypothetical protein [Fulvivirga sedimenti]|uniref:Lipoprotein n=1 Tax=Fulvivirga sedimenti TaxID=2879465 RepID=A0A9X1KVC8_9BACT|nr:hypothetical protein [Fulvivirga sedimenti]MCA6074613.1 hypothetical protein [Fulvivirga sedimenti]MCA6075790.1 hypothetical protein [Fulvivirga sedimenti]MCA6076918.1 hypothetical protein [Fulvivirga sedimenti]
MKNVLFILIIAGLSACSSTPAPGYLDKDEWKSDRNGCMGYRSLFMQEHPDFIDALKGQSEETILLWLGKPDKNELYKRNQKFYIYLLDPGPDCGEGDSTSGMDLQIRFSATNRATEVMLYRR